MSDSISDAYKNKVKFVYDSLPHKKSAVKEKFSMRDSDGNDLTVDQAEYFRNSKVQDKDGGVRYQARSNGPFDDAEISSIQRIGRKPISQFSVSDLAATEKLAKTYWGELGTKSPFFRAWFGNWREYDTKTPVHIVTQQNIT